MTFSVPDEAVTFILLQRTGLQKFNLRLFRKLGIPYYPRLCHWESRWRRNQIADGFVQTIVKDYEEIRPHLPAHASTILDIGCGVAGIDVALSRHYSRQRPHFHLLDKSLVSDRVFYDFRQTATYYNSHAAARSLLTSNGVAPSAITCLEAADTNRIEVDQAMDLVISLISWGFHYPVSTYLAEVVRVLSTDGSLILDVRRESSGLEDVTRQFATVTVIAETRKYTRILARNAGTARTTSASAST